MPDETEPTYAALERLRDMLAARNCILSDTREVDGEPWVLMSPELMMQLITDKEQAEAEVEKWRGYHAELLAKFDPLTPTGRERLEQAEAEADRLRDELSEANTALGNVKEELAALKWQRDWLYNFRSARDVREAEAAWSAQEGE